MTSVFQNLTKTVDGAGPLPPLPPKLPKTWDAILLNDNFETGLNGWHTHTSAYPPALSDHGFGRSPSALKLGTGTQSSPQVGGTNSIYKRVYETYQDGYLLFGGWLAFRGTAEQASPGTLSVYIDHQRWDDSARAFGKLNLNRFPSSDTYGPEWTINADAIPSGSGPQVAIPGASMSTYPATPGQGVIPGWNVNHAGYWFAALVMSCNQSDNVSGYGLGRYWRAYVGNNVFDLSTINADATGTQPGCGAQNPQVDSTFSGAPNPASSFSGGQNFGLGILNRTSHSDGPAALLAGHLFAAHYPVGTVFPTGSEG